MALQPPIFFKKEACIPSRVNINMHNVWHLYPKTAYLATTRFGFDKWPWYHKNKSFHLNQVPIVAKVDEILTKLFEHHRRTNKVTNQSIKQFIEMHHSHLRHLKMKESSYSKHSNVTNSRKNNLKKGRIKVDSCSL